MLASGCAAARAFYDYCRKTKVYVGKLKEQKKSTITVTIEFLIVSDNYGNDKIDSKELETLERVANAIKKTARIVDTPCNEMNVEHFLDASQKKKKNNCSSVSLMLLILDTNFRR